MGAAVFRRAIPAAFLLLLFAGAPALAEEIASDAVNTAKFGDTTKAAGKITPWMIRAQVLLDRAHISPGVIDGYDGENFRGALREFQRRSGLEPTGRMNRETWDRLASTSEDPVTVDYQIAETDVNGPFTPDIPEKLEDMAKLDRLAYRDAREALAERFHMDEDLLEALNRDKAFDRAGEKILVANVRKGPAKGEKAVRIEVDKREKSLRAYDEEGEVIAFYPATIGSQEKPAPSGTHAVRTVVENPSWSYDPRFKFDGIDSDRKLALKPGPNNPVGSTWIDLDVETYGIHGTPEPSKVGKSESHGCVRLTNWDAAELAGLVEEGTQVDFGS